MSDATEAEIDAVARALAQLEPGEDWPTNSALGGSLTGTRDDEYRSAMRDQAREAIAALDAVRGTEVEWGVQLTRRDGIEQVQQYGDERQARQAHAVNEQWFAEGDIAWCNVWRESELVSRTVGPWTVVDGGA